MKKPTVLTARSHDDLLAAVPCILGFEPEESLVMLTFGTPGRAFHARVDLPKTDDEMADVVASMTSAAVTNAVAGVAIIAYTADRAAAGRATAELAAAMAVDGIAIGDMLVVDDDLYWPLLPDGRVGSRPRRFDAQAHRFRAEAVMRGRVVHESRAQLAATIAPRPSSDVEMAVARVSARRDVQEAAETVWLLAALPRLVRGRTTPTADEAARILVGLRDFDLLDIAIAAMDAGEPDDWLDLWSHLTRCAPERMCDAPAALLAFAAWRAGQGALAWCAVDRCREVDPDHGLAGMVARLLERAMPPSAWTDAGGGETLRNGRPGP